MDFLQIIATYAVDAQLRAEAIAEGTPTLKGVERQLYEMQLLGRPPKSEEPKARRQNKPYAPGYREKRQRAYQKRYHLTKQQPLTEAA